MPPAGAADGTGQAEGQEGRLSARAQAKDVQFTTKTLPTERELGHINPGHP